MPVAVAPSPPIISGIQLVGGNLILTGTNGTAGASCFVLSATNVTTPMVGWQVIATNQFGPGGSLSVSIPVEPDAPQTFYRLRLP